MTTIYNIDYLNTLSKLELWNLAKKNSKFKVSSMESSLQMPHNTARVATTKFETSKYDEKIKKYLIDFLSTQTDSDLNLEELFKEANKYQKITNKQIAEELGCDVTTVSASKTGKSKGKNAYLIKEYLENIINQYKLLDEAIQQDSIQEKERETMTE